MGSNMKRSIFDEQTSKALKKWHKDALHHKKHDSKSDHSHSPKTLGKPIDTIPMQPLNSEPAVAAPAVSATETASPNQTANIMASVDLNGDHGRPNDKGPPFTQLPDLLS